MKRMFNVNLAILAMVAAVAFVMVSCDPEPPKDPLFESHSSYSIQVSNLSGFDLVAFRGSLTESNRIGGIPAGQHNHGLPRNPQIFPENPTHFQMLFITRKQYDENRANLGALTNYVFTRTYVFWNGSAGDNSKVYEISDKLGGIHRLQIWNTSNYNVEFREDGINGPTIGYVPSGITTGYLYVEADDYLLFPVFQRYNSRRDIMETIVPITESGYAYRYPVSIPKNAATQQTRVINLSDAVGGLGSLKTGVVAINVVNSSSDGAVNFVRGDVPMYTPSGNLGISSDAPQEFTIELPKSGSTYAEFISASGWWISQGGIRTRVKTTDDRDSFRLYADKMYVITVSGSYTNNSLEAVIDIEGAIDFAPPSFNETGGMGTDYS